MARIYMEEPRRDDRTQIGTAEHAEYAEAIDAKSRRGLINRSAYRPEIFLGQKVRTDTPRHG